MQISAFLLPCINFLFSGSAMRLRWSMETLHLLLLWPIPILLVHTTMSSLSGVNLSDYDLISCTKDGFVSTVLKPMDNRLNHLM
jgi:hypothetical protein